MKNINRHDGLFSNGDIIEAKEEFNKNKHKEKYVIISRNNFYNLYEVENVLDKKRYSLHFNMENEFEVAKKYKRKKLTIKNKITWQKNQ